MPEVRQAGALTTDRVELRGHGAELVGEVTEYGSYRMCYLRGPDGVTVALTEQLD